MDAHRRPALSPSAPSRSAASPVRSERLRSVVLAFVLAFVLTGLGALGGCDGCRNPTPPAIETYEDEELAAEVFEQGELAGEPPPPISDAPPPPPGTPPPPPVVASPHPDPEWANDLPVDARRFVYRVRLSLPSTLGSTDDVALPAAELYLDVAHDRLRARFVGPGWAVQEGSEVRLRRDYPGVYLFDGLGGRPLVPGELALWFEGGRVSRRGPALRVVPFPAPRRPAAQQEGAPGELVCALLAELSSEPWEAHMRRCERGAPAMFRIGYWRAEQTAGVPVELPRRGLRADEQDPPTPIAAETSRAFLEPGALARIATRRIRRSDDAPSPPDETLTGLRVQNESPTRALVLAQGVLIGWVDSGAAAEFVGLSRGSYEVSAIRPLGAIVARARDATVPGSVRLCDRRCPRRDPAEVGEEQ